MSYAIRFNSDQAEFFSFGKELSPLAAEHGSSVFHFTVMESFIPVHILDLDLVQSFWMTSNVMDMRMLFRTVAQSPGVEMTVVTQRMLVLTVEVIVFSWDENK